MVMLRHPAKNVKEPRQNVGGSMAKEYDKEIRKLFGDYKRAKSRMTYLEHTLFHGNMNEDYEGEYNKLRSLVNVVDVMLSQLTILQQQIIEYYYILGESMYDIAELLNYSYYHCSNNKNEAVDELNRIFKSTRFDSIIAQEFERKYDELKKEEKSDG